MIYFTHRTRRVRMRARTGTHTYTTHDCYTSLTECLLKCRNRTFCFLNYRSLIVSMVTRLIFILLLLHATMMKCSFLYRFLLCALSSALRSKEGNETIKNSRNHSEKFNTWCVNKIQSIENQFLRTFEIIEKKKKIYQIGKIFLIFFFFSNLLLINIRSRDLSKKFNVYNR